MKAKNTLLFLTSALIMSACQRSYIQTSEPETPQTTETNIPDTVRVIGVFNQPQAYYTVPSKYLRAVNKYGKIYDLQQVLPKNADDVVKYIERGDTIVIQGDKIVKNLTMERLKSEYTKCR